MIIIRSLRPVPITELGQQAVDCRLRFLLFQFIIFITHSLQLERIAQVLSKSLRGAQMRLDYRAASPADLNRKKQD
jgi:hypothetical protein